MILSLIWAIRSPLTNDKIQIDTTLKRGHPKKESALPTIIFQRRAVNFRGSIVRIVVGQKSHQTDCQAGFHQLIGHMFFLEKFHD